MFYSPDMSSSRFCWATAFYAQVASLGVDGILWCFERYCQSEDFGKRCATLGFADVIFHRNQWNGRKSPGYAKFAKCLEQSDASLKADNSLLGLVFHGTPMDNIAPILKDGLDKDRRRRQQYGPGEYFCKVPGIPERYCAGGLEMVVFVAILPQRKPDWEEKVPPEYVVVENNEHHIAIGTLQFKPVRGGIVGNSQRRQRRCAGFHKQIMDKEEHFPRANCCRGTIIQELMLEHRDIASDLYRRWHDILSHQCKQEIAWYVHQQMQDALEIHIRFPGLPQCMETGDVLARRDQTLKHAGFPNPEKPEDLLRLPTPRTRPLSLPPTDVVPPFVPPTIPTYVTSAGQRAFRLPRIIQGNKPKPGNT